MNAMHGWWIDGEFVPCECTACQFDREEEDNELFAALQEIPELTEA